MKRRWVCLLIIIAILLVVGLIYRSQRLHRIADVQKPAELEKAMVKTLQNTNTAGSATLSLDALLSLKKITTGEEPNWDTYEVPVSYDVLIHRGDLRLLVDDGKDGYMQDMDRATNGDCLLEWGTTYDPPGQHVLRARLSCYDGMWEGPASSCYSTNIVQLFQDSFLADDRVTLHAKTIKPNAIYSVQIKILDGKIIKTCNGATTNGIINMKWDLPDNYPNKYINLDSVNVFNTITLDSGCSQTVTSFKINWRFE
jgi:hypothetical protein